MSSSTVKFVPFSSLIDPTFWHQLADKKLNEIKLDSKPIPATATYRNDLVAGLPPLASFDFWSFRERDTKSNNHVMNGEILITNTIEEFKSIDKQKLVDEVGNKIYEKIKCDENLCAQKDLFRFLLLTYLDLKKFHFYYWFSFPALSLPKVVSSSLSPIDKCFNTEQLSSLEELIFDSQDQLPCFLVADESGFKMCSLNSYEGLMTESNVSVVFADPSNTDDVGWTLRNILCFLSIRYKSVSWKILAYRLNGRSISPSLYGDIVVDNVGEEVPATIGWERNEKGQLAPRKVDLSAVLDPEKIAQNAVSLNLKLMRWRLVPDINLEKIANCRCLLLGAGTLGCHVARSLLGWGVNHITLIDNSKVSYSNPVRQSLYEFGDCVSNGKQKAVAAAEALKRIYPKIESVGINMSIPMPGHSVSESNIQTTMQTVQKLEQLIKQSNCIYLLMDTRESRWLPTLLAQAHKKLVINAALGFDTFLVQRHGLPGFCDESVDDKNSVRGYRLGCYFCNDVVAPGNSTRDRTLDQQCTVTRPGVSMMAAALAVELMVSVLQHPLETDAPASTGDYSEVENAESCLGIVPHQVRGFLSQFQQVLPTTAAFSCCTGCSPTIVDMYKTEGFDFLLKAFNDASFLEEVSGLKQLHTDSNLQEIWELSDDESSIEG